MRDCRDEVIYDLIIVTDIAPHHPDIRSRDITVCDDILCRLMEVSANIRYPEMGDSLIHFRIDPEIRAWLRNILSPHRARFLHPIQ